MDQKRGALIGLIVLLVAAPGYTQGRRAVIVQTNAAGDNIHLIDPASNKVTGEIGGIEVNHGVAAAPDGSRFYVTNESQHTLDVVDGRTLRREYDGVVRRLDHAGLASRVTWFGWAATRANHSRTFRYGFRS